MPVTSSVTPDISVVETQETSHETTAFAQEIRKAVPGFSLIQDEMEAVEKVLRQVAQHEFPELRNLLTRAFTSGGKRLRPALVLLASHFYPVARDKAVALAAGVETIHTATLVHDDVIDQSLVRRGHPTFNVMVGTKVTILAGDYLFGRAAELVAKTENTRIMDIFARGIMTLCAGEIRQNFGGHEGLPTLEEYHQRIYGKTASLFEAAAEAAAVLSGAPEPEVQALRQYGYALGMAFQIVDDILDFTGDEHTLGKPAGADLRAGLITLPVMQYMRLYPQDGVVQHVVAGKRSNEMVAAAVAKVRASQAIPLSIAHARQFVEEAQEVLKILPESPYRTALHDLAIFVIERTR